MVTMSLTEAVAVAVTVGVTVAVGVVVDGGKFCEPLPIILEYTMLLPPTTTMNLIV